ncbi:hypothetical protein LCGC14_2315640 [marine sediment metagenome]|uniref:Uncharacterized protein n=1 Tax=marine sediment metagenome TaxID=412755 RepID=A0A0F9CJW8_9ZZZZ
MSKAKAGRLLSRYIREIAAEATVPVPDAEADNGVRMETRAEALARQIWKLAEGYEETIGGKIKVYLPDKNMIAILLDRLEGRVPTIDAKDQKPKATIAERVGDQSRRRLNALADKNNNSSNAQ